MKFEIKKKDQPSKGKYEKKEIDIAYEFAKKTYKEFGSFLKAIVLFGSTVRKENTKKGDIDILMVVDDVTMILTGDIVEAYRLIVEKIIAETSSRIHVTTLKFTSFWEYTRVGDPIGINILREGMALIDSGFFEPMQQLLIQGKIRPSAESVWIYYSRAPKTLINSQWHIMQGALDLYWAVIDSAHAGLMKIGAIPPTPAHVADLMDEKMVKEGMIEKKYVKTMKKFYDLAKRIGHKEIKSLSGKEYDEYLKEAKEFVDRMKRLVEN